MDNDSDDRHRLSTAVMMKKQMDGEAATVYDLLYHPPTVLLYDLHLSAEV
jgi:hypothetical protein